MEIGVYTFADIDTQTGAEPGISPSQRMRNLMEEIDLAEQAGLDVFALGEHHRPDYLVSAPSVVLGAAAARTQKIRLSSAVTVLSSEDPVRVFQQFATLDLLSKGRAEIMVGRGSFIESFPLFGYQLKDYDDLFEEKLEMLLKINSQERVTWKGRFTQSLNDAAIFPRPVQPKIPIWVAVGGTPESVVRAAEYGLPMALAIIGGSPARFKGLTDLYRKIYEKSGHDLHKYQLSINSHVFIGDTSQEARDIFYPPYARVMNRIGRERGWPPLNRDQFDGSTGPQGALLVGSPQEVIDKILYEHELFSHTRFLAQMSLGTVPHKAVLRSIELLGTQVLPEVKKHAAGKQNTILNSPG